jgi:ElaB/YqjD/DUF883 family membrane-anchored ribosome-binding protein
MSEKDKYSEQFESLFDKWDAEFSELEDKIRKAGANSKDLDERIKSARAELKKRLDSARKEYGELEEQIMGKVHAADEFIHVKPLYAIGGTLITGLFLGWLVSRK